MNIDNIPSAVEQLAYGFRKVGQDESKVLASKHCTEPVVLKQLIELSDHVVDKYGNSNVLAKIGPSGVYKETYKQASVLPAFAQDDIFALIAAKSGCCGPKEEQKVFGLLTGVLAHVLTDRNNACGKRTVIYGSGINMNYLFYNTHIADMIILDKCSGSHILEYAASDSGSVNCIVLNKVNYDDKTHYQKPGPFSFLSHFEIAGTASHIAQNSGRINTLVLNKVSSGSPAKGTASQFGRAGIVILNDIAGDCGADIARNKGTADMVLMNKLKCEMGPMFIAADSGLVHFYALQNSVGSEMAALIAHEHGKIDVMLLDRVRADNAIACGIGGKKGQVKKLVLSRVKAKLIANNTKAKEIITGNAALQEYKILSEQYKLEELVQLTESIDGKAPEEIMGIADSIALIYNAIAKENFA